VLINKQISRYKYISR